MHPSSRFIFIGGKFSNKKQEQEIKGTLVHELCHHVMNLVFNNDGHPYYKHAIELKGKFDEKVKRIFTLLSTTENDPDECNGLISSVLRYNHEDINPELIVRVVQILAEFDNNPRKLKYLQYKYDYLFEFFEDHVLPEMKKFLERDSKIMRLNGILGFFRIAKETVELCSKNDIKALTDNKLTIVTTNVPKLLLIDIYDYLAEKYGDLIHTKNLLIEPKKLKNKQIWKEFKYACKQALGLNIFIDCTKGVPEILGKIFLNENLNFIFIVSNKEQRTKLAKILNEVEHATEIEMSYNFGDLTAESQKLLLETKIYYQNNSKNRLLDLFRKEVNPEEPTTNKTAEEQENIILKDFFEIIDGQTLNLLMEKSKILIEIDKNLAEKSFKLLYQKRGIIEIRYPNTENDYISSDHPRNFKQKSEKTTKISQKKLLEEVKGTKYVLLSDMAGNGKSWTMKYFALALREQNPTKWVAFVDLKQYIEVFRAQLVDFLTFIIQNVLELQTKFEQGIFKKLYEKGKIVVFFDGFNEIAPNCAEFVSKLALSIEFNGGNQLWIATRDYFQTDLQKKLQIDVVYKLDEFTEDDGINYIIRSWMLNDLRDLCGAILKDDFEKYVKDSQNFSKYEEMSRKIVEKVEMDKNRLVGQPQIFKMIADLSKDDKEAALNLKEFELYKNFMKKRYNRWLREKGPLREEANAEGLDDKPNFIQFHKFHAVKSMFPEYAKRLVPNCNENEWPEEEVIAFGLIGKNNEEFYFSHETYCEFFVAVVLVQKITEQNEPEDYITELFVEILTIEEYEVIRMFLNRAIEDYSTLQKFEKKVISFLKKFYEMDSFNDILNQKIENLMKFGIKILNIFLTNKNFKEVDNFKKLMARQKVFNKIIESSLEIEDFEKFVTNVESKIGPEFIRRSLIPNCNLEESTNIFNSLIKCSNLGTHKIKKFFKLMKNYASFTDICYSMKKCDHGTVLETCIKRGSTEIFEILWKEIKNFFEDENSMENFKELVKHKDSYGKTLLCSAAQWEKYEFHAIFWELLLKLFKKGEELKNFILEVDEYGGNFVHELVRVNSNLEIIAKTFEIFKNTFSDYQFNEIIKSKDRKEQNLLHIAADSKDIKVFEFIWAYFRSNYHSNEEFLKLIKEVDKFGNNILHIAAHKSQNKFFEFIMKELKEIAHKNEIKELLSSVNAKGDNLLQIAVPWNLDIKLHIDLWETFSEYFETKEVLEFIKHDNNDGDNLLYCFVDASVTEKALKLTWNKIKWFMTLEKQIKHLKTTGRVIHYCHICNVACSGDRNFRDHTKGEQHNKHLSEKASSSKFTCELCKVECNGSETLDAHLRGKNHKNKAKLKERLYSQTQNEETTANKKNKDKVEPNHNDDVIGDLGVEYIVSEEIKGKKVLRCQLCDKTLYNSNAKITHLNGKSHQQKYKKEKEKKIKKKNKKKNK